MTKFSKVLLITGGFLVIIGFILSAFNIRKIIDPFINNKNLNTVKKERIVTNKNLQSLNIDTSNEDVVIEFTNREDVKITYYETKTKTYSFHEDDEELTMNSNGKFRFEINFWSFADTSIKVSVPEDLLLEYNIITSNSKINIAGGDINSSIFKTSNGKINMSNVKSYDKVNLKTSNSSISIKNSIFNDLQAETSNGSMGLQNISGDNIKLYTSNSKIELDDITVTDKLYGKTSNGRIELDDVTCDNIDLRTSNSRIEGTIIGSELDYMRNIKTSNSSIVINDIEYSTKLVDKNTKDKKLTLKTSNGKINIEFDNKLN